MATRLRLALLALCTILATLAASSGSAFADGKRVTMTAEEAARKIDGIDYKDGVLSWDPAIFEVKSGDKGLKLREINGSKELAAVCKCAEGDGNCNPDVKPGGNSADCVGDVCCKFKVILTDTALEPVQ